jgi:hypothetical protein
MLCFIFDGVIQKASSQTENIRDRSIEGGVASSEKQIVQQWKSF